MKPLYFVACLVAALALLSSPQASLAQQAKEDAKPAAAKAATAKKPAEPRGRLPNFYREVVDNEQRARIYKLQEEYDAKIEALSAQLQELVNMRTTAIEAVLTADQLKKVKELQAASKEKSQTAAAKKASVKVTAEEKPGQTAKTPAAKP